MQENLSQKVWTKVLGFDPYYLSLFTQRFGINATEISLMPDYVSGFSVLNIGI